MGICKLTILTILRVRMKHKHEFHGNGCVKTAHALLIWICQPPRSARAYRHVPQLLWSPILSQLALYSGAVSYASGHDLYDFGTVMGLISLGWNKFQPECQGERMWLKVTSSLVHFETMFGTLSLSVKEVGKTSGLNTEALFYSSFVQEQLSFRHEPSL